MGGDDKAFEMLCEEVREIRRDVRQILEWRWKLYGVSVVITIITGALFEFTIALLKHG